MAFSDYIHCEVCACCKPEDRGDGYKMLYVGGGDLDGLPDGAVLLCGKHAAEHDAKIRAGLYSEEQIRAAIEYYCGRDPVDDVIERLRSRG